VGRDGGNGLSLRRLNETIPVDRLAVADDMITADLNAVADYVSKLPAANGKVAVAGFCWGGGQSFRFATNRPGLAAAFVFYGTGPETAEAIARIKAPVHGF